jgi:hypothetical protein
MNIRNRGVTYNDVTVVFAVSATQYQLHKVTLGAQECLEYVEGVGFFTITAQAKLNTFRRVTADQTFALALTMADVTDLSGVTLYGGRHYSFIVNLFHTNNATTTGSQFAVNHTGGTPTDLQVGAISTVTNSATAAAMSAGSAVALNTAVVLQTTGQTATGYTIMSGAITPLADGTFAVRATSEVAVASGLVVKKNSWMQVRELDN